MKNSSEKKIVSKKKNKKVTSKATIKKHKEAVLKLESEILELNNKYIRLLAEFDNFKKRNNAEKSRLIKYEGKEVIRSILPVLDDLNRTINIPDLDKNGSIYKGINMIIEKIIYSLNDIGVKTFDSLDKEFDIELHEALMTKKSKLKSNTIIEEYEKGYKYHDKVIRHAKVIVSE